MLRFALLSLSLALLLACPPDLAAQDRVIPSHVGLLGVSRVKVNVPPPLSQEQIAAALRGLQSSLNAPGQLDADALAAKLLPYVQRANQALAGKSRLDGTWATFLEAERDPEEGLSYHSYKLGGGLSIARRDTGEELGGMHELTQEVPAEVEEALARLIAEKLNISVEQAKKLIPDTLTYYVRDSLRDDFALARDARYGWTTPDPVFGPALAERDRAFWGDHAFSAPGWFSVYDPRAPQAIRFAWDRHHGAGDPAAKLKLIVAAGDPQKLAELIAAGQMPEGAFRAEIDNDGEYTLPAEEVARLVSASAPVSMLAAFFTTMELREDADPTTRLVSTSTDVVLHFLVQQQTVTPQQLGAAALKRASKRSSGRVQDRRRGRRGRR